MNDNTLVKKATELHDKRAFGQLVAKYQSAVRRFFLSQTLGNAALSDDLAQETFIKAYTHIAQFSFKSAFSTWLFRIACNTLYDYNRANKPTESIDTLASSTAEHPRQTANDALRMDLYRALSLLKPDERTCISLQLLDGMTISEIATITNLPEGTIKSHLARAKNRLANYLRKNGYDRS